MKKAKKKQSWVLWATLYPTGKLSSLLYEDDEIERVKCMDKYEAKLTGEKPYGRRLRVRITPL